MKKKRRTIELAQQTAEMFARCVAVLKPPPELTLSQWADTYRMLSAENSATPGRWHTDNAPYQREIMDAIGDQHVRKVVVMSAAQIGKTAMLMNMLGYYMHYYPAPVLVMQPTLEMGQTFSKDFLAPMIRDTPVLRVLVDTKSRYSGNTILKKNFPGGHVTIIGANSRRALPADRSRCCCATRWTATRPAPEQRATRCSWRRSAKRPFGTRRPLSYRHRPSREAAASRRSSRRRRGRNGTYRARSAGIISPFVGPTSYSTGTT